MKIRALIFLAGTLVSASAAEPIVLPARDSFHLFLLAGQSNMAGRGKVSPEDKKTHPRVLALSRDGAWVPAVDPIHYDKSAAGVGLGKSFATALAEKHPEVTIGLIPAACGGSPIATWTPGGYHGQTRSHPYDDAVKRARRAMKDGVLKGILWHQGESDCKPEAAAVHEENLEALIGRLREALDAPGLPFLIGQLGQFPKRPWSAATRAIDRAHRTVAEKDPRSAFVSSEGLTSKSDNVHFNAASLRTFGTRYARAYQELTSSGKE